MAEVQAPLPSSQPGGMVPEMGSSVMDKECRLGKAAGQEAGKVPAPPVDANDSCCSMVRLLSSSPGNLTKLAAAKKDLHAFLVSSACLRLPSRLQELQGAPQAGHSEGCATGVCAAGDLNPFAVIVSNA